MKHAPGTVEDRLTRLERSAARWRAGALAAIAVLAIVMLGGAGEDKPAGPIDVLDVHTLRVLDDQGNRVAIMSANGENGAGIILSNPKDKASVRLLASPGHAQVAIENAGGTNGVRAYVDDLGGAIATRHTNNRVAFQTTATKNGGVFVQTSDANGETIWTAPTAAVKSAPPKTLPPPKF